MDNSSSEYKRGVEDALQKLTGEEKYSTVRGKDIPEISLKDLYNIFDARRKSLLTKKVTQWVNVYQNPAGVVQTGCTYDSKEEAKDNSKCPMKFSYVGTYPLEIEVSI